jgi:hypothetical protein
MPNLHRESLGSEISASSSVIRQYIQHPSLISFESSTSWTSFNTLRGIGSLAGKAIYAVGEAAIRGFEVVEVERRVLLIKRHLDGSFWINHPKIYKELLEFTRYDVT